MYDYTEYSIAELADMLSITNLKIFSLVDIVSMAPDEIEKLEVEDIIKIAKAGKKAQMLNSVRSKLKNAIDRKLMGIEEKDIKTN